MINIDLWKQYNEVSERLSEALGRTHNHVGDYAEHLINMYLNGSLLNISNESADIEKDGKLYQVKARKLNKGTTTKLGVIRSWKFDYLAVIIFLLYPIMILRVYYRVKQKNLSSKDAFLYACSCILAKFPLAYGQSIFIMDKLRKNNPVLIEYKH